MSQEPHADPVPADVPPIESPADGTEPMRPPTGSVAPAWSPPAPVWSPPAPGWAAPPATGRPRPRWLSRGLVTAYFAGGLVLLLAGIVAVIYLGANVYGGDGRTAATGVRGPGPAGPAAPESIEPSGPLLERIGPQRLSNGGTFVAQGERGAKFEVTVRVRKVRKKGCDPYARKPKNGGYLPTELRVKVLSGEPQVSDYDFRFQRPDGTQLTAAFGSSCDKDYGAFVRRLVAGRTYQTTIVFDVPNTKGDIVFRYPSIDTIATWHLG